MYKYKLDEIYIKEKYLTSEKKVTASSERLLQIEKEIALLNLERDIIWRRIEIVQKINSIIMKFFLFGLLIYFLGFFGIIIAKTIHSGNVNVSAMFDEYPFLLYLGAESLLFPVYSFTYKLLYKIFFGKYGGDPNDHEIF